MSAGKNLMVIPAIITLVFLAYLALNLRNSSTSVIGAVVIEPGFSNLQPQINGRHYHANGQYNVNIRSYSNTPLTVTEIKLIDKATQKECNATIINPSDTLNFKQTITISAKCPKRGADDVYLLSAEINYKLAGDTKLHQETGDLTGDVER